MRAMPPDVAGDHRRAKGQWLPVARQQLIEQLPDPLTDPLDAEPDHVEVAGDQAVVAELGFQP